LQQPRQARLLGAERAPLLDGLVALAARVGQRRLLIGVGLRQQHRLVARLLLLLEAVERDVELGRAAARLVERLGLGAQALDQRVDAAASGAGVEQHLAQLSTTAQKRLGTLAQAFVIEPEHLLEQRLVEAAEQRRQRA